MIFNYLLILFVGVTLGGLLKDWLNKLSQKTAHNKLILDRNKQFKEILEKVNNKKSRFKTRINNTIYIGVKLEDKVLLDDIIFSINKVHYNKIVDVVDILGLVFYREDFERSFGVSLQELKDNSMNMLKPINEEQSDIQKIINNNNNKLDIDDILDRINKVGIKNLTEEEKEFLNKYNK